MTHKLLLFPMTSYPVLTPVLHQKPRGVIGAGRSHLASKNKLSDFFAALLKCGRSAPGVNCLVDLNGRVLLCFDMDALTLLV